jgi:hypothetical protein
VITGNSFYVQTDRRTEGHSNVIFFKHTCYQNITFFKSKILKKEITLEIKMQDVIHDVSVTKTISNEGIDNGFLI